jgi:hypothetical protein
MSDLFSNLAAQSLGSIVGVQPLVPPLFAPAPQLLFGPPLPAFEDPQAEIAENATFSNAPPIAAGGIGTAEMEQPSHEVVTPEKRTMSSDLLPPDAPQTTSAIYSPVNSAKDDTARSSSVYRLLRKSDGSSTPQAIQPQKASLSNTENSEIMPSSVHHEEQESVAEKSPPVASSDDKTQQTSPKDHPVISTVEAFHDQKLSKPSDHIAASLPIKSALPVSIPLLPRDDLSAHSVPSDKVLNKKSSSSMQTQIQSSSIPGHMEGFLAPDPGVSESTSTTSKSKPQATVGEQTEATSRSLGGLDERTIKPLIDQNTIAQNTVTKEWEELKPPSEVSTPEGIAQVTKARLKAPTDSELFHSTFPAHPSNAQDALHSSRAVSKLEAYGTKAESEVSPISITIGRVIVRVTQAAQPTQIKKLVLRPAQSLDEYLKQRERGSR